MSDNNLVSFCCMCNSSFPNNNYWGDLTFSIVCFRILGWKLFARIGVSLPLGFQFCYISLCGGFSPRTVLLLLLQLCSIIWTKTFFFLRIALAIQGLLWFYTNLRGFFLLFYLCENCHWDFDKDCVKSIYCFT